MNSLLKPSAIWITTLTFLYLPCLGNSSPKIFQGLLLVNLKRLNSENPVRTPNQRRAFQELNDANLESNKDEFASDSTFSQIPSSISSTFSADTDGSIETSKVFEEQLVSSLFNSDGSGLGEFTTSLEYLVENKINLNLSDGALLSAVKSLYKGYISSQSPVKIEDNVLSDREQEIENTPKILLDTILPKISNWGGNGPTWVKRLAQISTEGLMEMEMQPEEIQLNANAFTSSLVNYIVDPSSPDVPGFLIGLSSVDPSRLKENESMRFGGLSGFDPENFASFQQVAVGLSQGFFNSKLYTQNPDNLPAQLTKDDFLEFSNYDASILKSATDGLLDSLLNESFSNDQLTEEELSLYVYDSVKSLANGFVISTTLYGTSEPEYLESGLYLDAAELTARGVAHSAISNDITNLSTGFSAGRLAEASAHGAAMGGQLATVLPQSMEFTRNWEIFNQSRRDISKAVSRGSSFGSVDAASIKFFDSPQIVESVSQRTSLGSMVGTTGLAIYYPTDQLVPIINFTAQGSSFGSLNSKNLNTVKPNNSATELIDVAIARQSALGSAMGAVFEPSVLLGLSPDAKENDRQTVDNLSAASFGATFGAIQGRKEQDLSDIDAGKTENKASDKINLTEITQSSKQGATEGALAGAKLALGLEDTSSENLGSKGVILKAINNANAQASSNANSSLSTASSTPNGSQLVGNPLRTSSKDMLLLMRKFGINPRYTNAATMFKRPVVPQIDEPPEDLVSETSPVADSNETYSESISNASPI